MFQFSVAQLPSGTGGWPASAVVWRTCVREIAFVDPRATVPSGATILHDEGAYAHLLEVICGLDSPISPAIVLKRSAIACCCSRGI